ncbi:MAG: hypothetical protein U1E56_11415 [Bauldia sp.]
MINPALDRSPQHAKLIGSMVLGYTELEVSFMHAAALALRLEFPALHAFELILGETLKLKVIHALSRGTFAKTELGNAYAISHKMIHECLNIRNRYAHCNWRKDGRQLEFLDAKDIFKDGTAPQDDERWRRLTIPILKAQAAFFEGTRKWLLYLGLMLQASEDQKPLWKAPPQMQPPPGHSERRKRSPARVGKSRPHKRTKPS